MPFEHQTSSNAPDARGTQGPRGDHAELSGFLVVDKPLGMTSMRVVEIVRRRAGRAKTGHAGTLDPLATGVLIVALGKGTRCIEQLMGLPKWYDTVIDLSAFTATDDSEAAREEVAVASPPTREHVAAALHEMVGTIHQRPPAFSAIKVQGQRSYAGARKALKRGGPEVDRPAARPVTIHSIELIDYAWPTLSIRVHCGRGTYIRSIARDLGVALGTGGYCLAIRRTAIGPYSLDRGVTMDALPDVITPEHLLPLPKPPAAPH